VGCALGNNHEPWEGLGGYHDHLVTQDWMTYRGTFLAPTDDADARLFFDLAKSDAWVEIIDVVVHDETNARELRPRVRR
jgi:hypothetical protein